MDTSNVFNVIVEQSGTSNTGWGTVDFSTAHLEANFDDNPSAAVRTFDVGQSAISGTISMAMAISYKGADNLILSLQNANSAAAWAGPPSWTAVPFDAEGEEATTSLAIESVMFAETQDFDEFIIVDIDRSSNSSVKDITRYHVDPAPTSGPRWTKRDLPVDVQAGPYQSCVGRPGSNYVDGIYTMGLSGNEPQLGYTSIFNEYQEGTPPLATRFSLPGGAQASAIAAARNTEASSALYATTDLHAVSGSTLYRLPADEQLDLAVATPS